MAISNCFFSPTSENPSEFSAWCLLARLKLKYATTDNQLIN